jgi:hypothetical protein
LGAFFLSLMLRPSTTLAYTQQDLYRCVCQHNHSRDKGRCGKPSVREFRDSRASTPLVNRTEFSFGISINASVAISFRVFFSSHPHAHPTTPEELCQERGYIQLGR